MKDLDWIYDELADEHDRLDLSDADLALLALLWAGNDGHESFEVAPTFKRWLATIETPEAARKLIEG